MASPVLNKAEQARKMAKMQANREAARETAIAKEANGFSLTGMLGGMWSVASLALFMPGVAKGAVGLIGKLPKLGGISKTAREAIDLHQVPVGQFVEKSREVFAHTPRIAGALESGTKRVASYANNTLSKSKLGDRALSNLKDVSVGTLVMNTGFAVQQTASVALSLKDKLSVLQQMQEDITGKRPSKMTVLMGSDSLNPMVRKARAEAVGGKALAAMGVQLAGAAGNLYLGFFDKSKGWKAGMKMLGIGFAPGSVSNMLTSSDTSLNAYKQMTLSIAQSGQAPEELYRYVAAGFVPGPKTELVDKMAKIGAEQNMAPKEYLQMMSEMMKPQAKQEITPVPGKFMQAEMARRNAANNALYARQA